MGYLRIFLTQKPRVTIFYQYMHDMTCWESRFKCSRTDLVWKQWMKLVACTFCHFLEIICSLQLSGLLTQLSWNICELIHQLYIVTCHFVTAFVWLYAVYTHNAMHV